MKMGYKPLEQVHDNGRHGLDPFKGQKKWPLRFGRPSLILKGLEWIAKAMEMGCTPLKQVHDNGMTRP